VVTGDAKLWLPTSTIHARAAKLPLRFLVSDSPKDGRGRPGQGRRTYRIRVYGILRCWYPPIWAMPPTVGEHVACLMLLHSVSGLGIGFPQELKRAAVSGRGCFNGIAYLTPKTYNH
jgi:hypothetical protein